MPRFDEDDSEAAASAPPARGKTRKLLIIGAVALVVIGAAVTAALLLQRGTETPNAAAPGDQTASSQPQQVPLYLDLDPPFVVNLNEDNAIQFLQVTASVMAYDPVKLDKIKAQMPLIRHHLVLLFSNQTFADIRSRDGKLKLQAQARDVLREALTAAAGEPLVEALYLTAIVAQ
ncbi:MAG: flagellar basal body-associated FliL family protein [Porticoccaceae bacterium]